MFLAAAISLANIKTEKEELWLVLGDVLTYCVFMWGKTAAESDTVGIYTPGDISVPVGFGTYTSEESFMNLLMWTVRYGFFWCFFIFILLAL